MSSIPAPTGTPIPQDRIDYNPAGYDGVGKDPPGNGKTIAIAILIVIGVVFFAIYFTFKCTNWRPWSTKRSEAGVQAVRPAPAAPPRNSGPHPGDNVWRNQVREPDLEMGVIPSAKMHDRCSGSTNSDNTATVSYGNFPEPGSYGHVFGPENHTSTRTQDGVNPYSPYPSADNEPSPYASSSSSANHTSNPYYQSPYPRAEVNQTAPSSNIFARRDGRRPSAEYIERNKTLVQERLRSSRVPQLDTSVAGKGVDKPLPVVPGVNRTVSPVSDRGMPGNARSVSPVGYEFEEISLEDGVASPGTKKARGYWK